MYKGRKENRVIRFSDEKLKEYKKLGYEIRDMDGNIIYKPENPAEIKAENEALKAENEKLKTENEALKAENEKLKTENEALKAELDGLKKDAEKKPASGSRKKAQ